jgi:DNA-binding response OmpR family regulator
LAQILLVEGEKAVAEPLVRALARAGHATTTVTTGAGALALADEGHIDHAFVDASLPDADSHAVTDALHQLARAPVVQLSDSREQADRDAWHDGAEDYVVKPVDADLAVKLVRAVLRRWRAAGGYGEILRVGPVELDTVVRKVRLHGTELKLPPKEIAVLARLMRHAGSAVPRTELMRDVWGEAAAEGSRTLDVHVGTLRSRLGDDPSAPRFIHTVRGVGFRFSSSSELGHADDGQAGMTSDGLNGHRT